MRSGTLHDVFSFLHFLVVLVLVTSTSVCTGMASVSRRIGLSLVERFEEDLWLCFPGACRAIRQLHGLACRKLWSPAVAFRRSGRDVSVWQQRDVRTVQLCSRQLPWVVSSGQLRGSFQGRVCTGTRPARSCPQGHGPHNLVHPRACQGKLVLQVIRPHHHHPTTPHHTPHTNTNTTHFFSSRTFCTYGPLVVDSVLSSSWTQVAHTHRWCAHFLGSSPHTLHTPPQLQFVDEVGFACHVVLQRLVPHTDTEYTTRQHHDDHTPPPSRGTPTPTHTPPPPTPTPSPPSLPPLPSFSTPLHHPSPPLPNPLPKP